MAPARRTTGNQPLRMVADDHPDVGDSGRLKKVDHALDDRAVAQREQGLVATPCAWICLRQE